VELGYTVTNPKKGGLAMTPLLSLRGRLQPAETIFSLLSLQGAEGDEAISVEDGCDMYIGMICA